MKPENKNYILENIKTKSVEQISQELGIREKDIRRFIQKERARKKQQGPTLEAARATERVDVKKAEKDKKTGGLKELSNNTATTITVLAICLIIVAGFATYCTMLNGEFLWDDIGLVKNNFYIQNWSNIAPIFLNKQSITAGKEIIFYRPLQMVTYMCDYSLWKFNSMGYHLTSIIIHICVALCIYWFTILLFKDGRLSLLTSLFFVVHPIHIESVSYISGRSDSLGPLFLLIAFIFYIKSLRYREFKNAGMYILAFVSYIAALLSRENSLIFPVLLIFYHWHFKVRVGIKKMMPILAITVAYLIMRVTLLSPPSKIVSKGAFTGTALLQRVPGMFRAFFNYIRLLLVPFNQHMEYGSNLYHFNDVTVLLGIVLLSSLVFYAIKIRKTQKLVFFSLLWFFITLLPVSNIYPLNAYMAEHWLYLPSLGFFLLLAKSVDSVSSQIKKRCPAIFSIIPVIAVLVFYSRLTIKENNYWNNPLLFYQKTVQYAPESARLYNNLGNIYLSMKEYQKAITAYTKAIEIDPNYADAYSNLGNIYFSLEQYQKAITAYTKAIELNPNYEDAYFNLANTYNTFNNDYKKAIPLYKKAIELNPNFASAYYNLGRTYGSMGDINKAISLLEKAIALDPNLTEAYDMLAAAYTASGHPEKARSLLDKRK
ncbi:MAG: tetratricopeptide repeat protein [Candidatus Omnitrophica bacterium]|nr:tetratricopeptide repeat protein [Candidatus Omnitrophota bacterium]